LSFLINPLGTIPTAPATATAPLAAPPTLASTPAIGFPWKISLGPHSFDPSDSRCDPKMSSGKDKVLRVHLKTQAYNSVKTIRVADKAKNVEIIKEVCTFLN